MLQLSSHRKGLKTIPLSICKASIKTNGLVLTWVYGLIQKIKIIVKDLKFPWFANQKYFFYLILNPPANYGVTKLKELESAFFSVQLCCLTYFTSDFELIPI